MTDSQRQAKIDSYGKAYNLLIESLERFSREMWQYRPAEDQWSIHEIVVHIADSEANSYVRCRRFLAEPGETLMAYDEMRWGGSWIISIKTRRMRWRSFAGCAS